jgi:tetratricopeptide (TPR) repeat protein
MKTGRPAGKSKRGIWILSIIILISISGIIIYCMNDKADKKQAGFKQRGNEYLMKEDYLGAKEEFSKALELEPGNLVLYFQLAEACIGLEDYGEAAEELEQAIAIAGKAPIDREQYEALVIKLAECYRSSGEEEKREEILRQSLQMLDSNRIEELLTEYN